MDDRGWDGWMSSPTQWTWVWVSSGSWWWTGSPGGLQSVGSQRVIYNWTELNVKVKCKKVKQILLFWIPKSLDSDCSHEIKRLASWKENCDKPRQYIKNQRYHFANKDPYTHICGFSVVMYWCESWIMDHKEDWALKNWCFWIVVLKTLESPLGSKEGV